MNRLLINILIDLLAAVALTVMVATGIVIWFILPPGTSQTHSLWGLLRHEWGTIHAAAAVLAARCANCHGDARAAARVRATTPEELAEPQAGIRWVAPGDPAGSRLFEVIGPGGATSRVAPVHQLEVGEVAILREWIRTLASASGGGD